MRRWVSSRGPCCETLLAIAAPVPLPTIAAIDDHCGRLMTQLWAQRWEVTQRAFPIAQASRRSQGGAERKKIQHRQTDELRRPVVASHRLFGFRDEDVWIEMSEKVKRERKQV